MNKNETISGRSELCAAAGKYSRKHCVIPHHCVDCNARKGSACVLGCWEIDAHAQIRRDNYISLEAWLAANEQAEAV
jgi:hypothetical protein